MKTFLYNLNTKTREGAIREGIYLVDGKPGILPDYLIELEIVTSPQPNYNSQTQTLQEVEYADIPNKKWVINYTIRDLTGEEIYQRLPEIYCTPRQFRLALLKRGITKNKIDEIINSIADPIIREAVEIEWEYALQISNKNTHIIEFAKKLGFSSENLTDLFNLAVNIN